MPFTDQMSFDGIDQVPSEEQIVSFMGKKKKINAPSQFKTVYCNCVGE